MLDRIPGPGGCGEFRTGGNGMGDAHGPMADRLPEVYRELFGENAVAVYYWITGGNEPRPFIEIQESGTRTRNLRKRKKDERDRPKRKQETKEEEEKGKRKREGRRGEQKEGNNNRNEGSKCLLNPSQDSEPARGKTGFLRSQEPTAGTKEEEIESEALAQFPRSRSTGGVGRRVVLRRPSNYLTRRTCSSQFREKVFDAYPILRRRSDYAALMEYLLLGKGARRRCLNDPFEADHPLLLGHDLLADLAGYHPHHGDFRSGKFLENFRRDVLPDFDWKEHQYTEGGQRRTRQVSRFGFPEWLESLLKEELSKNIRHEPSRVWFASGRKYSARRDRKANRDDALRSAERSLTRHAKCDDQRRIAEHLNGLAPHALTRMLNRNYDEAHAAALAIDNPNSRHQALLLLRGVLDQPVPIYVPVRNSYRLFNLGYSLQQLNGDVRAVLMNGCIDLDAGALHLCITAAAWEVEELQELLRREGAQGFWRVLTTHVAGRELSAEEHLRYKKTLKSALYAAVYGGGDETIVDRIRNADDHRLFPDYDGVLARMKEMPAIEALLLARKRVLDQMISEGGMTGYYGWVPMKRGCGPLTVLSEVASSYEMALIAPLISVAGRYCEYVSILLYQFDGITIRFSTPEERMRRRILAEMKAAFGEIAKKLGIATDLEVKPLGRAGT